MDATRGGLIVIPARRASTRLPDKLLLEASGRPLLAHVVDRCLLAVRGSAGLFREALVACDDPELARAAREAGVRAVLTRGDHLNGTSRIAEAVEALGATDVPFVVNVQGDEPELDPRAILRVAEVLVADPAAPMATLAIAMPPGTEREQLNPNAVKAIVAADGRALYFTRAAAPYDRNPPAPGQPLWYRHLGIYAYRTDFLLRYATWPASPLETRESLEQLRALEAGATVRVGVVPADWAGRGIDTPEDWAAFLLRAADG